MGRELRRKQAKKDGKSLERVELKEDNQIKRYVINIVAIVGVFAIIYLISALFITKEINWFSKKENSKETNEVANTILALESFKQSETSYYIYFYDFDEDEKESDITNAINNDSNLANSKVYKVNTKSALNANYVSNEGNKKAKTIEDLKVVNHTLIKIENDTIVEYYEGNEITDYLN